MFFDSFHDLLTVNHHYIITKITTQMLTMSNYLNEALFLTNISMFIIDT